MSGTRNLNYIKNVWRHPCAADPVIMVETAFEAALPLLFVPWTFSCTDWIKASQGISWKCGRKLSAVAKHVYGAQWTSGVKWYYEVSGAATAETALWYWFLYDLGTGFVADWSTLIYEESRCDLDPTGYLTTGLGALVSFGGTHGTMFPGGHASNGCSAFNGTGVLIQPGCFATVTYSVDWGPFLANPANQGAVTMELKDQFGHVYDSSTSDPADPRSADGKHRGAAHVKGHILVGTQLHVDFFVHAGLMQVDRGSISVTATGRPTPLVPAGCFGSRDGSHSSVPPQYRAKSSSTPIGKPIPLSEVRSAVSTSGKKAPKARSTPKSKSPSRRRPKRTPP